MSTESISSGCTTSTLCRLCLNKEALICVFDERLANGHQLRMCILLCTGVQINEDDRVSKMVCHKCCSLAVKLYQYRQTALANDKALKEIANEPFEEPPTNKDAILELHKSILENISQSKVTESVARVYRVPNDDVSPVNNDGNSSAHDTVEKSFQYFPNTVVPREILDSNVLPSVPVDRDVSRGEYEVIPADNSDGRVLKFKRKYPATDVVKLALKKPRKDDERPSCRDGYSGDDDSNSSSVFKTRRKQMATVANSASDASYSDCDSDIDTRDKEHLRAKDGTSENTSSVKTRPTRCRVPQNPLQFPDSDSDNEVTKKPANTKYCAICDRTFWGWSQLKSHQRTHLRCVICRIICDSQEDLEYHVKNVCYKNIEYNQPILLLPKVDENPFMLHIYKDAFDQYFQDIEDGVYGSTEPPPPPDPDYPFYHDEERVRTEIEFIKSVFERFKHLDNTPVVRNKISQTRRAETHIKYYSRNQIVLEDMYRDLNMYKVPINVAVSQRVSAHLSFATKPFMKEPMEKWSVEEVVDIVVPQKDPTYFLRPKKPPPVPAPAPSGNKTSIGPTKHFPGKTVKQEKHPKLLRALTASTAATASTTSTTTTTTATTAAGATVAKSYNIAKLLSTTAPTQQGVKTVTTPVILNHHLSQLRFPTRISSEVSLLPKAPPAVPKSIPSGGGTPIYTNIMFRLPVSSHQQRLPPPPPLRQPHVQQPPQQPPQQPLQQPQQHPLSPYIKEEPELSTPPVELPAAVPHHTPAAAPPPYSFRLPTPPVQHNQNELYLKQEQQDIDDSLSGYSVVPLQYNRPQDNGPNMPFHNRTYRMSTAKPSSSHIPYNQQVYRTQQQRYAAHKHSKASVLLNNQQYYNANHHQNGMRYRSVSGGGMMVLPNSPGNQISVPQAQNLNSMPATHLLQTMNHMSSNLTHHSSLNHHTQQQNQQHVNSMYSINSPQQQQQPSIGKMSPISSVPSPLHSVSSPIDTKPLSSPISSMPPPLSTYNTASYNTSGLYDHSYVDTFSSNSYSDSFAPSTYLPPQTPQQYITPYSPHSHMDIDPFVDQMLQQAAGSNSKTQLRVKQPWELNQT